MADNTTLPGTGNGTADIIVATDKIGGVDFQRVKLSLGADGTASDAPVGAGTEAGVLRVTLPTDGTGKVSAAQSGTWTVQPGNTANTTAWKVDGSAVTQPVSLASVPSHAVTNAGTFAVQAAGDIANAATDSGNPVKIGGVFRSSPQTLTNGQRGEAAIDSAGRMITIGGGPTTATTAGTQVASSATSVTLLASNGVRRGMVFYNNSTQVAYVKFGATASTTSFSVYMTPGAHYELVGPGLYAGVVDAIWAAANGNMQVTEW